MNNEKLARPSLRPRAPPTTCCPACPLTACAFLRWLTGELVHPRVALQMAACEAHIFLTPMVPLYRTCVSIHTTFLSHLLNAAALVCDPLAGGPSSTLPMRPQWLWPLRRRRRCGRGRELCGGPNKSSTVGLAASASNVSPHTFFLKTSFNYHR